MRAEPSRETASMLDAYVEYNEAAQLTLQAGATAHDVTLPAPSRSSAAISGSVTSPGTRSA